MGVSPDFTSEPQSIPSSCCSFPSCGKRKTRVAEIVRRRLIAGAFAFTSSEVIVLVASAPALLSVHKTKIRDTLLLIFIILVPFLAISVCVGVLVPYEGHRDI